MENKTRVEGLFYFDGLKKVDIFTPKPVFEPCTCINNEEDLVDDICRYCDGTEMCLVESITANDALDTFADDHEFKEMVASLLNQKEFLHRRYGKNPPSSIQDYWLDNADLKLLLRMIADHNNLSSLADRLAFAEKLSSYQNFLTRLSKSVLNLGLK